VIEPSNLIARALEADPDSAERILYATAAFDSLTDQPLVLVGGGAQVTHTGVGRLTDIDLVGVVTEADQERLAEAGFRRDGRHWVFETEQGGLAVEVPSSSLTAEETAEQIELDGATVLVISATDLMMDRLLQATDGTQVTRDEATQLAVAAGDRIDWQTIEDRARRAADAGSFLSDLPELVAEFRGMAGQRG
jgi:hypothetical protein